MRKKKVLIQTDAAVAKTGFGRTAKALLLYLYKTNKYDLVHYSLGCNWSHASTHRTPWKTRGCLPDSPKIQEDINRDPTYARRVGYGAYYLDRVVEEEQPDIYIGIQDIWGLDFAIEKPWFNQITSVVWTTLDSLPILPKALEAAPVVENYWIWSDFATKAMHKLGHSHIKTMHGPVESKDFKRLDDKERATLRASTGFIPADAFVVGFVFRNQLRKSIPNLLEGFKKFQDQTKKESRLVLHTSFTEGWNIIKLAKEYGINEKEILTTYICDNCQRYQIAPYLGEKQNCKFCLQQKSMNTTNSGTGVTEPQLNEIYNLMDVYCHPFTSGGQEIPIQEAKLAELVTLVTNYSCGEDLCVADSGSIPLDWSEYREHGTEFIKASTKPYSIAKQLRKVFNMKPSTKRKLEKQSRKWALQNYSVETIGKSVEEFIDAAPFLNEKVSFEIEKRDPNVEVPDIKDDEEWIMWMYHNVLKMKQVSPEDEGLKYWIQERSRGKPRKEIEEYFRKIASRENSKSKKSKPENMLSKYLDKDDENKRVLYIMPGSIGDVFLSTSLFRSLKELYPDYNLYVATNKENQEILDGNPHVHKVIPYFDEMDNQAFLEGHKDNPGHFEIAFLPHVTTQRILTYLHNGKDKIAYKDLMYEN